MIEPTTTKNTENYFCHWSIPFKIFNNNNIYILIKRQDYIKRMRRTSYFFLFFLEICIVNSYSELTPNLNKIHIPLIFFCIQGYSLKYTEWYGISSFK